VPPRQWRPSWPRISTSSGSKLVIDYGGINRLPIPGNPSGGGDPRSRLGENATNTSRVRS
jgi:hypothetical protein